MRQRGNGESDVKAPFPLRYDLPSSNNNTHSIRMEPALRDKDVFSSDSLMARLKQMKHEIEAHLTLRSTCKALLPANKVPTYLTTDVIHPD